MQDREAQSDVNPGRVERGLDAAPTQGAANSENEGLRGGPVTEREREDGGARPASREDPASGGGLS